MTPRSGVLIAFSVVLLGMVATASHGSHDVAARAAQTSESPAGNAAAGALNGTSRPSSTEQLALGRHLKTSGALFYGAWWCPACTKQKELFGKEGASALPYVECDQNDAGRKSCQTAKIKAFPTWDLNGKERLIGVRSLEELKRWSGFND